MNVFLADMAFFGEMNEEYERFFGREGGEGEEGGGKEGKKVMPARSCVAVRGLPKGVDVEIECVALP